MPVETKSEWVERVLGFRLPTAAQAPPDGLTAWRTVRVAALGSLKALESAFRGMKEPETDRAIILLRAIQANLTEAPRTPAQVGELETYIYSVHARIRKSSGEMTRKLSDTASQ